MTYRGYQILLAWPLLNKQYHHSEAVSQSDPKENYQKEITNNLQAARHLNISVVQKQLFCAAL